MPKKIYISSTYRDLGVYRAAAFGVLEKLKPYFEIATPMENMMPGSNNDPLTDCLLNVNKADIYVLIIGRLYGSVTGSKDLSFTEQEYREAIDKHKIIIPLVADQGASGFENVVTDRPADYDRFKNEILTSYIALLFSSPDHFGMQLSLSLYRFSEKKWPMGPELKLRCDRSLQYFEMVTQKQAGKLNTFALNAVDLDMDHLFFQRMAIYEFGLDKGFIKGDIEFNVVFGLQRNNFRQKFIYYILEKQFGATIEVPKDIKEGLQMLRDRSIDKIFGTFSITLMDAENKANIACLKILLDELSIACEQLKMTFYLTFIFRSAETNLAINDMHAFLDLPPDFSLINMGSLEKISERHVSDWLSKYVTEDNDLVLTCTEAVIGRDEKLFMREFNKRMITLQEKL